MVRPYIRPSVRNGEPLSLILIVQALLNMVMGIPVIVRHDLESEQLYDWSFLNMMISSFSFPWITKYLLCESS